MWFLLTGKSRTKRVADGEVVREHCPVCKRTTQFVEVEVEHSAGLFFVDLLSEKDRKFACTGCGETFDRVLEEGAPPAKQLPAAAPVKSQRERVEELAAEQHRRDAAKAQIAAKIDDELAELKRRMGK